ncbi:MAG: transketolase [Candidatus Bipolaricaulia bacterium]
MEQRLDVEALQQKAQWLRRTIVKMVTKANSGHPGGAMGHADVLVTLHYRFLRDRPNDPWWPDRDRFLLSNGHTCPGLYTILADKGYFPEEELWSFRRLGAMLQGHPSTAWRIPGIEISGGSLGHGLSIAVGMALAGKLDDKDYRVYCMISDGESQAGQPWEAGTAASHYRLDNLCAILDHNGAQIDGRNEQIMEVEPLVEKWQAFGWQAIGIDGHDYEQIIGAFEKFLETDSQPTMIVANNIIGKGVSFMEDDYHWHHGALSPEQLEQALNELS